MYERELEPSTYGYAKHAELQGIAVLSVNGWIGHATEHNVSKPLNGAAQQGV